MLTKLELERIQKSGANARAIGRTYFDNPYLKDRNLPASTGDTPEVWEKKRMSWEIGWRAEDLMRA